MPINLKGVSRRDFLKTAGIVGAGSLLAPVGRLAGADDTTERVPQRPFGNTGIDVSILSFGGSLNTSLSMLVLRQAVNCGVTYWDTANSYMGGRSEKGMGKYFEKYPADRQRIFLVTKSHAWSTEGMSEDLALSLERMQTDYIDLYFMHSVSSSSELTQDKKAWAEKRKAEGKIRLFGFSTHSNMEECMLAAAELGWIDGIMMRYNYRLMHTDDMRRAMDACAQAGIGLTAMKSQGGGQVKTDNETELKLAGRFLKKGFTDAQAKLKAVWEHPNIASICTEMPNMTLLMSNIAAAKDKTKLSAQEIDLLQQYARETISDYCSGCTSICQSAIDADIPIGDVMRCLMYARSYDDRHRGRMHFQKIPLRIRQQMEGLDYGPAEHKCPQKMAIGKLMREAIEELG
ncbi:MAG: aldo/keto reductase [Desulfobacterales bacterium]|nr:MAG: aldo/keto reductase [Desulfobacterales bacterium]